jgi:hypothetical protein
MRFVMFVLLKFSSAGDGLVLILLRIHVAEGQNDPKRHSGGGLGGFSACQGLHWCHEHGLEP